MKVDIECSWSDEDMRNFPHLKHKDFTIIVDTDYVEDEGDLISCIADEIYREYDVIIETGKDVKNVCKDFYGVVGEIFG